MSAAELVLLGLVNRYGSDATAAYGAVGQVMTYVQFPALSIAISVSIFGAQAIGRGQAGQIGAIVTTGLQMNLWLTGGLAVLGYLFARPLMGLFITETAVLDLAERLLHIVLWSTVLPGWATAFFRGRALGRHGMDAACDLVNCNPRGRGAVGDLPQPSRRNRGNMDGLSYRLLHHVPAADELLPAGLAQAAGRAPHLTQAEARYNMMIIIARAAQPSGQKRSGRPP